MSFGTFTLPADVDAVLFDVSGEILDPGNRLLHDLREAGVPMAALTTDGGARRTPATAEVLWLFDALVDGGQPATIEAPGPLTPAILLRAARQLGVDPASSALIGDERSGVEAARGGGFGTVIGVDGRDGVDALFDAGADAVVGDMSQVRASEQRSQWRLGYRCFEPEREGLREALCTTGNGYFATRGAAPEERADGIHYPGTYVGGVFNRLTSHIAGREVRNESIVNVPNWLTLSFRIENGAWFHVEEVELLDYGQQLDLRSGVLTRRIRFRDEQGRRTNLLERRFVSMAAAHLAALEWTISAENWTGSLEIRSGLDGGVENTGVARYRALAGRHLSQPELEELDSETVTLKSRTVQSQVLIAIAARTRLRSGGEPVRGRRRVVRGHDEITQHVLVDIEPSQPVTVEKVVSVYTSRDPSVSEPSAQARRTLRRAGSFAALLDPHRLRMRHLWDRLHIAISHHERTSLVLNLHLFHLLQTVSENTVDFDVGIPARGLHGEAYRGHVFWDELFVFPLLTLNLPELARSLLRYRHRRLPEARRAAHEAGYRGAMFPWQSGSDGREESQTLHLNPLSGRWLRDNSYLQRHIGLAIAYNVWQYHQATADAEFLSHYGAPLLLEIARFWGSVAEYDHTRERYDIRGVVGPDEYHDRYPWRDSPGIDNNAYTNVMVAWTLCRALELLEELPPQHAAIMRDELGLTGSEIERWRDISRRMYVPFHGPGIISQFEGYERLDELDWDGYRERYGDIHRLDRILEAEGDTPNRFKASKQADVLMLFFLLPAETLEVLFTRLGYAWDRDMIPRNIDYYSGRTSHGSTLSRVVHSWVLARADRPGSWELFEQALEGDIADVQGGTTAEGVHLGAMAGTVDMIVRGYAGIDLRDDGLWLNPSLPQEIRRLSFSIRYRGHWGIRVDIADGRLRVTIPRSGADAVNIGYRGRLTLVAPGTTYERSLA